MGNNSSSDEKPRLQRPAERTTPASGHLAPVAPPVPAAPSGGAGNDYIEEDNETRASSSMHETKKV